MSEQLGMTAAAAVNAISDLQASLKRMGYVAALVVGVATVAVVGAVMFTGATVQDIGLAVRGDRGDVVKATGAQVIRQDASQRAILLVERGPNGEAAARACSEPPPDIAQNIAQHLSASLDALGRGTDRLEGELAAQVSRNIRSATESLFERSQGIQLLRDTMFRLCEAFQNGVLTSGDYRALIQDLISTANFIIPFEQCMGIARSAAAPAGSTSLTTSIARTSTAIEPGALVVGSCLEAASRFNTMRAEHQMRRRASYDECAAIARDLRMLPEETFRAIILDCIKEVSAFNISARSP